MRKIFQFLIIAIFVLLLTAGDAVAYLDPGSGSMILQVIIGGVAGALLWIKLYWKSIKLKFSEKFKKGKDNEGK